MFKGMLDAIIDAVPNLVLPTPDSPLWRQHLGRRRFRPSGPPAEYGSSLAKDRAVRRAERWKRANPDAEWKDCPTHIKHNLAMATN